MPAALTASTSSGTRTTLSSSENSVWRRRWTNSAAIVSRTRQELQLRVGQGLECAPDRTERAAVERTRLATTQSLEMRRLAVILVCSEFESRIAAVQFLHLRISAGLVQNRSRTDGS